MARLKIENNQLIITMQGARKFFALKGEITIPLNNVEGVATGLTWKELPKILDKVAGSNANGFYLGGTFIQDGDKVFYDIKRKEDAVVISLKDEDFQRLVIGVENPNEVVDLIEEALKM